MTDSRRKVIPKFPLSVRMDDEEDHVQFLSKYLPKFYHRVDLSVADLKKWKIASKMKLLKTVRRINVKDYDQRSRKVVTSTFKKHNKNVKSLNLNDFFVLRYFPYLLRVFINIHTLSSWKLFARLLHIKYLTLEFSGVTFIRASDKSKLKALTFLDSRLWSHLSQLKSLKYFHLQIYNKLTLEASKVLKSLSISTNLLKSLDGLTIFLNHIDIKSPNEINFPTIFQKVTSLKVYEISYSALEVVLQFTKHFQKLVSLTILKTIQFSPDDGESLNFESLKYFKDLHNLTTLDIAMNLNSFLSLNTFLQFFSVPKSIKLIKLNLYEILWKMAIPNIQELDLKSNNIFRTTSLFTEFYKKWETLDNLQSLSLCFTESENYPLPSLYFITPILEKLVTLTSLHYANWYNFESGRKKALDINYLCQSVYHLRGTLQNLYLENYAISLRNLQSISLKGFNLAEVRFCGFILGDNNLKSLFHLFHLDKEKYSFPNPPSKIEFERLLIDNEKTFPQFLESLQYIPRNLQVILNVDIRKITSEQFLKDLCHYLPLVPRKNSLALTFTNAINLHPPDLNCLIDALHNDCSFEKLLILDREENELFIHDLCAGTNLLVNQYPQNYGQRVLDENSDQSDDLINESSEEEDDDFGLEDVSFDDKLDDIDEDI